MIIETITSAKNEKLRSVSALRERKNRSTQGCFLVEGFKEISFALEAGYILKVLWVTQEQQSRLELLSVQSLPLTAYVITQSLFEKIGYREKTEGLLGVFELKGQTLETLNLSEKALILMSDGVEKPGNLGALFRVADAAGACAVIGDESFDCLSPNAIRASVGTVFTVPWFQTSKEELYRWVNDQGLTVVMADPHAKQTLWEVKLPQKMMLMVGAEHSGLSDNYCFDKQLRVSIPMAGRNDSLNVSVSAGILAYEWRRLWGKS